jgi:repressor LexA
VTLPGPDRRRRILYFIGAYTSEHGYSPTVREIGRAVGLSSSSSVFSQLQTLYLQGLVDYEESKPRTIRLTSKALTS